MTVRDLLGDLSTERLCVDIPPALTRHLSTPRFRTRLERRFLQRVGGAGVLSDLAEGPALRVVTLEEEGLRRLIADAGAMCQYSALRRIVDQSALAALSSRLDLRLSDHGSRRDTQGDSLDKAVEIAATPPMSDDRDSLAVAILREGLQCWFCWIHGQPKALGQFYRALTPSFPQEEADIATSGCRPRECRRRAALFEARLSLATGAEDASCEEDT